MKAFYQVTILAKEIVYRENKVTWRYLECWPCKIKVAKNRSVLQYLQFVHSTLVCNWNLQQK